ncbi:MAG: hypothetical protein M3373_09205 [Gemmatimonadota bacterium]|nr:hypothetical protein [Gemmatimonadota bacterium]
MRRIFLAAGFLALGCVRRPEPVVFEPALDWITAITVAQQSAAAGHYTRADSALAAFITDTPGTREAHEALYWRAIYQLDPANPDRSPTLGFALLERYLADSPYVGRAPEARVLRWMTLRLDSLQRELETASAAADSIQVVEVAPPPSAREEELEREVQRLKDQLEKANAELDLIRRRLTAPRRPDGTPPQASRP